VIFFFFFSLIVYRIRRDVSGVDQFAFNIGTPTGSPGSNVAVNTMVSVGYRASNVFTFSFSGGNQLDTPVQASTELGTWIHWYRKIY
jgi:hypothetical protein